MFSTVVAIDINKGIAKDGKIPWHYPEDLKFFKELTTGHVVIMGRKTYESIGHPLPNRINIVISSELKQNDGQTHSELKQTNTDQTSSSDITTADQQTNTDKSNQSDDTELILFNDLWKCVEFCMSTYKNKKLFVIGGGTIYKWFITNRLITSEYVTQSCTNYDCDTFYHSKLKGPKRILGTYEHYYRFVIEKFNKEEYKFLTLGKRILSHGNIKSDRTGVGTMSLFGRQMRFNLKNHSFPLLTTRKMFLRGIFEELMLYIRGQTDSAILEAKGIYVWKGNTSRAFLDSKGLHQLPVGDMGASYGFLFRHFGGEYVNCKADHTGIGVDQLKYVIDKLKNHPTDRRIIISLWDPTNLNKCPLPPCLYNYQFIVVDGKLSCMMTQRSSDFVVAGGWNIATGALLTYLLASVTNLEPAELIWNIGDVHVYKNLVDSINEQCQRRPYAFPKLFINKKENIEDYQFSDIKLLGYKFHPSIGMIMNV
jgi:dihydrofolate reductase/thymidylate synthase